MDIQIKGIDCSLAASEVDRIIYLAVSLVDPEGEKLKKMTTPPHQVETPPYPVKRQMSWYGGMLFSVGGRDLLEFQLMLRSKAALPDVSIATARVPISDLRSGWGVSCELLRPDGTNYGDLSFDYRIIGTDLFFSASPFNCLVEFEKDESELANSESRIPNPPPDLENENAMDVEVQTIRCYELGISFDSFYFAVSLVDPGGETLKKLVTPRSPVRGEEEPTWRGRMPFAVGGQDRLEIELVLRNKARGDVSMGSASVLFADLRSLKSVRGIRCPLRTVGTLGFSYRIIRYAPRDPHARSSSSPAAAIIENCRIEFEKVVSAPQASGGAEIPPTHQSDRADLAHIIETAGKSLRSISEDPESAFEEDDGELIFDTSVGKIDLSNCQVMENKDLVELKELGRGAFGTVYHGKWRGTDVAIKRINKNCLTGQRDRMILESLKEAGILASLLHPNIVTLYGFVLDELESGNLAIVTELVADGSLKNILLRDDKYLDHDRRLIIAKGAASGMEYLHLKKVVHFDLKCDNLLVDLQNPSSPICKVADFGLSKVKENTLVSGGFRGTIPWMAPELLKGDRSQVSEKVDVFSFGIVMWEILTGKVPYDGMLEGEIIGGIFNNTLRPPVPTSCEPRWRRLMEECWASNPQQRPSFTQIARRLHSMSFDRHAEVAR